MSRPELSPADLSRPGLNLVERFDFNHPCPAGARLPASRIRDFLERYPLPAEIGLGWDTLEPHYAKTLLALLYDASAETPALEGLFTRHILPGLARRDHVLDIGSGRGRLVGLFRPFPRITLVERDAVSLLDLGQRVAALRLPATILELDYHQLSADQRPCDLHTFTHSIYYFHEDWGTLARTAFDSLNPGGSLVFTLNGDEGSAANLVDSLAHLGIAGLNQLDIEGFIAACARIDEARVRVYRLPCRIHHQDQPEFMVHMARIFLEDLCTPIPTAVVRSEMQRRGHALEFVDKVIEVRREVA